MIDATLIINAGSGERRVSLAAYLEPAAEEQAHRAAYSWIKELRHATVDGRSFRQRFTVRGDTLWWFSEVYLHKERAMLDVHRALSATDALIQRERPLEIRIVTASPLVRHIVLGLAAARRVRTTGTGTSTRAWTLRLLRLDWRARALNFAAMVSRLRHGFRPRQGSPGPRVRPSFTVPSGAPAARTAQPSRTSARC